MFDHSSTQLANNYQQFVDSLFQNFINIGSVIEELIKAVQEKEASTEESSDAKTVQVQDKLSDIDVQIGTEKYRLVPDEEFAGAWKWESAEMTDFQEQTVLRRLVTEPAVNPEIQTDIKDIEKDSSLSVVAHTESGKSVVAYHQDSEGFCHTNIVTANLSDEEIIQIINQIITSSEIENDNKELESIADELLTQIESEIISNPQVADPNEPLSPSAEPSVENLPDSWEEEVDNTPKTTQSPETEVKIPGKPKQKAAASYTYEQISDSDVSPETKRWVREVEVPISNAVANSQAEQNRLKKENIKIAQTVVEMLKAYGEDTIHGFEAYKSDAFVIKLEGSKYSIHHRKDELYCFGNPLMQFSLDSKGNPRIEIPPTQMLPVEKQEFLMVGKKLEFGERLPDLAMPSAVREATFAPIDAKLAGESTLSRRLCDVADSLGSLAPAGTFEIIQEKHQWAESILPLANNIFQASRLENKVEILSGGIEVIQGNNYQLQLNRNDKTLNILSISDNRTVASYDLAEKTVITANPNKQDEQNWFLISQKSQVKQSKRNDIEL